MAEKQEVLMTSDRSGQLFNTCVWDPNTGSSLTTFRGSSSCSRTVTLVGNDYILSAQPDKPLLNVWQVNRSEQLPLRLFTPGKCSALAASPSGNYLVAGVEENISVWQVNTGRLCRVLSSHYQPVTRLAFSQDGSHFISAGGDGQVLCWSLAVVVSRRNLPGQTVSQIGKPDPRWVWRDHALAVTDLHVGLGGVAARVASVSLDQTCKLYSLATGQLLLSVSFSSPLLSVTMDSAEQSVFTGGENGEIHQFKINSPPRSVTVSSESIGTSIFRGHTEGVTHLSVSLDGATLASGGADKNVRLWHVKSGQCTRVLEHKGAVTHLQFLLPPPALLQPEAWSPARRLVALQKGSDSTEQLTCNVLSHVDKVPAAQAAVNAADSVATVDAGDGGVGENGEGDGCQEEMTIDELKLINNQLYKFAVKNVLQLK